MRLSDRSRLGFPFLGAVGGTEEIWWNDLTPAQRLAVIHDINRNLAPTPFTNLEETAKSTWANIDRVEGERNLRGFLTYYRRSEGNFTEARRVRDNFLLMISWANGFMSDDIYDQRVDARIGEARAWWRELKDMAPIDWEMLKQAETALAAGKAGRKDEAHKARLELFKNYRLAQARFRELVPEAATSKVDSIPYDTERVENRLRGLISNRLKNTPEQNIVHLLNINRDADSLFWSNAMKEHLESHAGPIAPERLEKFQAIQTRLIDIMLATSKGARNMLRAVAPSPTPPQIYELVREMSDRTVPFRDVMRLQPHRFEYEARLFSLPYPRTWPHDMPIEDMSQIKAEGYKADEVVRALMERGTMLKDAEYEEIRASFLHKKPLGEKWLKVLRTPPQQARQLRIDAQRFRIPVRSLLRKPGTGLHGLVESNVFTRLVEISDLAEDRYLLAHDLDDKDRILTAYLDLRVDALRFLTGEVSLEEFNRAIDDTRAVVLGETSVLPWIAGGVAVAIIAYLIWKNK